MTISPFRLASRLAIGLLVVLLVGFGLLRGYDAAWER